MFSSSTVPSSTNTPLQGPASERHDVDGLPDELEQNNRVRRAKGMVMTTISEDRQSRKNSNSINL